MSERTIGDVTIARETPRVVACLSEEECVARAERAARAGADLIELRLDRFSGAETEAGCQRAMDRTSEIHNAVDTPLILTARWKEEGGDFDGDEAARADLYLSVAPFADALDVELRAARVREAVAPVAERLDVPLILSYHDFQATPIDRELDALVGEGFAAGAALVKIACMPRSQADVVRLMALTERHADRPVVVIAMGDLGRVSRFVFPLFGSRLTYAHVGEPVAPGQAGIDDIRTAWRLLGWEREA